MNQMVLCQFPKDFCKLDYSRPPFFSFRLFDRVLMQLIVNKITNEWIQTVVSGVRSNRSTNCATTTAQRRLPTNVSPMPKARIPAMTNLKRCTIN